MLQMMPAPCIPRVQVRCVPRQGFEHDLVTPPGHKFFHLHPAMNRRAVPDNQQPVSRHPQQVGEELDRVPAVQRVLSRQRVYLSLWRHPAHDRQVIASLFDADDRRLTLGGIGPHQARQKIEPRFVSKNQYAALASRPLSHLRPNLLAPTPDGLLIPLDSSGDRRLGRPVQLLEQPANVVFVVQNAEFFVDHTSDAGACPNRAAETVGLRPVPEKLWNERFLGSRQLGWVARRRVSQECLRTATTRSSEPAADGYLGHTEGVGDVPLTPAFSFEGQRLQPPPGPSVASAKTCGLHTFILFRSLSFFAQLSVEGAGAPAQQQHGGEHGQDQNRAGGKYCTAPPQGVKTGS